MSGRGAAVLLVQHDQALPWMTTGAMNGVKSLSLLRAKLARRARREPPRQQQRRRPWMTTTTGIIGDVRRHKNAHVCRDDNLGSDSSKLPRSHLGLWRCLAPLALRLGAVCFVQHHAAEPAFLVQTLECTMVQFAPLAEYMYLVVAKAWMDLCGSVVAMLRFLSHVASRPAANASTAGFGLRYQNLLSSPSYYQSSIEM